MKKITAILVSVFVIGGAAIGFAAQNDDDAWGDTSKVNTASLTATVPSDDKDDIDDVASADRIISKDEASAIALAVLDGKVKEVELDSDDDFLHYEVEIKFDGDDFDFDIDAYTGEIFNIDDDLLKTPIAKEMKISSTEAVDIVLSQFKGAKLEEVDLEKKRGRYVYEVEIEVGDEDGDVYVDAMTGEIVKIEDDILPFFQGSTLNTTSTQTKEDPSSKSRQTTDGTSRNDMISYSRAGEIAREHIGKGVVDDIELETKNGKLIYEVEVEWDDDDVEVYIDAYTGEVLYVDYD